MRIKIIPLSYNFKNIWVNQTTANPSAQASTLLSSNFPTEPSSNMKTHFISSNNTPSPINRPTSRPSSTSLKNYQINTSMYSICNEPIPNSKIPFAPPSTKYHWSMSTLITPSKKKSKKETSSTESSMKEMFGQCYVHAFSVSARW